ncbi:hypothetical protein TcYC6_0003000 [Trypanosoma cruzi]|nr:hypothetical protein TcYC6_0003000 [Trypanosoma cruzi]
MTTCRIIQVAAAAPDERYMTTCRISKLRRSAPNERYMTTNRCIHAAATAQYERYMTTNRSIHAAAAAPYERYMTTNRGITLRRRTLNMSLSFSRGQRKCARLVRRSNLTPYVKMGRATTFFF